MTSIADATTFGELLDILAVTRTDNLALKDGAGVERTYGSFNARCNQLNAALAQRGLQHGSRVAVLSRNRIEYAEVFGLAKSGAIIIPINTRLLAEEVLGLLLDCQPDTAFVDKTHFDIIDRFRPKLPFLRNMVCFDGPRGAAFGYEELLADAFNTPVTTKVSSGDPLCVIYTSGTTGKPKGAMLSHSGVLANMAISRAEVLSLKPGDRVLAAMPFFHVGGLWYHFFSAFSSGCPTTILPEFSPEEILDCFERDRISVVHLVPTMVSTLLNSPDFANRELSALRRVFYAGSSMPTTLLRRAMSALPNCGFLQGYGSTEGGIITVLTPDHHTLGLQDGQGRVLTSCGKAVQGTRIRIMQDGRECSEGEIGEIELNSPYLMIGYLNNAEATKEKFDGEWLRTGDLGYYDGEGFFFLVDRKNDMIISGGENVFPTEVEDHLLGIDGVLEAAVFGVPDAKWVERVTAAVVIEPGSQTTPQSIMSAMRKELSHYKCPKEVLVVENLPKNGVGKVMRKALRQQYSDLKSVGRPG